jgi:recombination protein RecA
MARVKVGKKKKAVVVEREESGGAYFAAPKSQLDFFSTGCKLLDCAMGGGNPLGRIVNVIGDKSSGKSLLAIESSANFIREYPKGRIRYKEAEAAFDIPYAEALGMPVDAVDFAETDNTVESVYDDLLSFLSKLKGQPGFYILDSLDALSDAAEMDRAIGDASYGGAKAKKMSELFRRLVKEIEKSRCCTYIISQIRDKIGVVYGRKWGRSGGRALDFYASIVLVLSQTGKLKKTVKGVTRPYGIAVKAYCDKNKIALPYRECEYDVHFAYGIDDVAASVNWLKEVKRLDSLDSGADVGKILRDYDDASDAERAEFMAHVNEIVIKTWYDIEKGFLPKRRKYA